MNVKSPKILIVEDEEFIAEEIAEILKDYGYRIAGITGNGSNAIELASAANPDLILMDIMLNGDMDGIEAAVKIRNEYGIPVIFLTSHSDEKIVERAKNAEPLGYLLKPFTPKELFGTVETALNKQNKIKVNEERYTKLFQYSIDSIILFNKDGQIVDANEKASKQFGYKKEEFLELKAEALFLKSSKQIENSLIDDLVADKVHNFNSNLVRKNGKLFPAEIFSILIDSPSEPIIQLIIRDKTYDKKIEQALDESEEKFKQAFYTSPDAVNINRLKDGMYIEINEGFTQLTGYTREETIGRSSLELDIWADPDDRQKLVKGLMENGNVRNLEAKFRFKNGKVRTGLMSASIIYIKGEAHILSITRDIEERMESLNAIAESEQRFHTIFESSPNAIIITDSLTGKIIDVNQAASKLLLKSRDEIIGTLNSEIYSENKNINNMELFSQTTEKLLGDIPITFSTSEIIRSDGMHIPVEVTAQNVAIGGISFIQSVYVDITDKKRTEEVQSFLLRISQAVNSTANLTELLNIIHTNLGKFFDTTNFYVALYNEKDNTYSFPYHIDEFEEFDISKPVNLDKSLTDYVRRTGEALFVDGETDKKLSELGEIEVIGTYSSLWLGVPLKIGEKAIGVAAVQSYKDSALYTKSDLDLFSIVSENIAMAISRKWAEDSRREGEELLELFFSQTLDGIYFALLDTPIDWKSFKDKEKALDYIFENEHITNANDALLNQYNALKEEFLGITPNQLFSHNLKKGRAGWKILYENGKSHVITEERKLDGSLVWIEGDYICLYNDKGEIKGHFGIQKDITDKRKAELELRIAKENAEKSNKIKTEFLAQMSHEIRTPINSILSFSSLLESELNTTVSDDLQSCFDIIGRAGKRIIRTIDLILNMSEIQTGTYEYVPKNFDIYTDVLEQLYIEYVSIAKEKNINLELKKETNSTNLFKDEYTVTQIFSNLIDNAIKYTHSGTIEIKLFRNGSGILQVDIKDSGIGISNEYIPNLFNPFTQEEQGYTRKYEGNGLGLALVKKYCEMNNSEITISSIKNQGSTFSVIFN